METKVEYADYRKRRTELISKRDAMKFGEMVFTEAEELANTVFVALRKKMEKEEIPDDFWNKTYKYLDTFPSYTLFNTIRGMPKTALLHLHSDVYVTPEWFFATVEKYKEHVYMDTKKNYIYYHEGEVTNPDWKLYSVVREESGDTAKFDEE